MKLLRFLLAGLLAAAALSAPAAAQVYGARAPIFSANRDPYPGATAALDFVGSATAGQPFCKVGGSIASCASLLTTSRASVGYGECNGQLILFQANQPRITCQGLLGEAARTNVAQQSQRLDNAYWDVKSNLSVTPDATAAPDGTVTADKLVENTAATVAHTFGKGSIPATNATAYTLCAYGKAAGRTIFRFGPIFGLNNVQFFVDLSAGTTNTLTGGTAPTVKVAIAANGFYRVCVSDTSTTTEVDPAFTLVSSGTTTSYTGDGVSGVYLWQVDLQQAAFPTSPILTTSASATRAADRISLNLAGFSTVSIDASFTAPPNTSGFFAVYDWQLSTGDENNRIIGYVNAGAATYRTDLAGSATPLNAGAITANATHAIAGRSQASSYAAVVDAQAVQTSAAAAALPGLTVLWVADQGAGGASLEGYVRKLVITPIGLANGQLQGQAVTP